MSRTRVLLILLVVGFMISPLFLWALTGAPAMINAQDAAPCTNCLWLPIISGQCGGSQALAEPTPTPTPTPTNTPTATATPTGAPTATNTPVPLACGILAATVDGSLAEWTSKTPQYLSASNRVYLAPGAPPPSAADMSAAFWMACSGNNLMVAGVITDSVVMDGVGAIYVGDAAQVRIDGLGDGITRPGQDDHDVFVNPAGAHSAENRPMAGATVVARTTPGSNWRFEMSIPLSSIWLGIGNGSIIGKAWGLWDTDVTPTPLPGGTPAMDAVDQVMLGPASQLALPTSTPTPTPPAWCPRPTRSRRARTRWW